MVDKIAHYLMCKGGVYYFTRHVPNDIQRHYSKPRIVLCLKTRSKSAALKASNSIASKLDDFWLQMRVREMDVPASSLLIRKKPAEAFTSCAPKLSDALEKYCRLKGGGRAELFFRSSFRNIGYVIEHLGDRPLDAYSSSDAASFRDWLVGRGLSSSSIRRIFSTVRAVTALTIQEDGLICHNAFSKTFIPIEVGVKRVSISPDYIKRVQRICLEAADERRLLVALISDTGMRLSEALGLIWKDLRLDHEYPHIQLVPHSWRPLKTSGSKRLIPLVGVAYKAVKIMHQQRSTSFLFNSYTNEAGCKGNSCSAALNKWLKHHVPDAVIHSFRHSFRDRLRNAGVQSELIDQLGGWSRQSVGEGYGKGYDLAFAYQSMLRLSQFN